MATVNIPFSFSNGDPIIASQHNSNWSAIEVFVNGLAAGGNQFDTGAISTSLIADGAVTSDKLASNSVTTVKIVDANVTTAKIADSSITSAKIADGAIVNADVNAAAGIVDTKLATIATAGKVSNSATTAVSANTASAIVARDASGNFTAGTITAALTGNVTGNLTGNVTGNVSGSSGSTTGNAATATALATARNIGGVSFNGTADINLPGVNTTGNQNTSGSSGSTTGNAATATALATARNIGGVSFNGTANIDLPGVNTTGNQNTSGSSASCSGNAATATNASDSALLNGYASSINGTANTIARVDSLGILAGTYFGMGGSSSTFWYATTFGGTTIFRATSDGVYAQAISSPRAVQVNSNGTLGTVASTRRAKENIVPYSDPDNKILNVGAVTFDYKAEVIEEEDQANRFNQFGMIAEDLHDAGLNHLVHYDKDEQCSGINYQMLAVELLGVV